MVRDPVTPAMCCVAPEIPTAMYRSGRMVLPVWPICQFTGTQPASVGGREAPTAPPNCLASSASRANPSGPPSPRPPPPAHVSPRNEPRVGLARGQQRMVAAVDRPPPVPVQIGGRLREPRPMPEEDSRDLLTER